MKKPLRFNLLFRDGPVATLDDLEEKMNINDLCACFQSGDLERWLRTRGESERADGVSLLEKNDGKETLLKLFGVLELGFHEDEVQEIVESYESQKKLAQIREELTSSTPAGRSKKTIAKAGAPVPEADMGEFYLNRLKEYWQLVRKINSYTEEEDFPIIKPLVEGLFDLYPDYVQFDGVRFISSNAFAGFAVMMNLKLRSLFCSDRDENREVAPADDDYGDDIEQREDDDDSFLSHRNNSALPRFYSVSYDKDGAGLFLKTGGRNDENMWWFPIPTTRKTSGYECSESRSLFKFISVRDIDDSDWRKMVSKGKRVMILSSGGNIELRGDYVTPEEEQMPIIDNPEFRRIRFTNAYSDSALFYMEVDK